MTIRLVMNPGTEPVEGACEEDAIANLRAFLHDLDLDHARFARIPDWDKGGRFAFAIWHAGRTVTVEMPGLALREVRFLDPLDQNPWDFPRLYVDRSSWLWCYALDAVQRVFEREWE